MRAQSYVLGVDLGTTFTAAAVARPGEPAVGVPLGSRAAAMPTIAYLGTDGEFLVGEAAARRALTDPDRVVREFKRRVGDDTPLLVGDGTGGDRINAHRLVALVIAWVVNTVSSCQGERPETVVVTHPAAWGAHKQNLLRSALVEIGVSDPILITEPHAAAVAYADSRDLEPGARLAVYDLGGGTFDASVMLVEPAGEFTPLGRPIGLPDLGGIDFDDAILAHVVNTLGDAVASLDPADPVVASALTRLRQECVDAKEALSVDTVATVPVVLGGVQTNLRLTRGEFEVMIEPAVARTLEALEAALAEADLSPGELRHLLLTGGSARIPFITQALSAHLGPNVTLGRDLDPKLAVALGAAMVGRQLTAPTPIVVDADTTAEQPALCAPAAASTAVPPRPSADLPELATVVAPRRAPTRVLQATATLAVLGVVGAALLGVIPTPTLGGARNATEGAQGPGRHLQEERSRSAATVAEPSVTDRQAAPAATQNTQSRPVVRPQQSTPSYRRTPATLGSVRRSAPAANRRQVGAPQPVAAVAARAQTPQRRVERPAAPAKEFDDAAESTPAAPAQPQAATAPVQPSTEAQPTAGQVQPSAPQADNASAGGTALQNTPVAPAAPAPPVAQPPAPRARGFAPTAPPTAPGQ